MKKVLSLLLAFVFVVGICVSAPVTITATAVKENEGFRFYLNDDGTAYELCQIYGKTGKVTIPETHNGLPVETIDIHQNWNESYDEITEIEFPDTLKEIEGFSGFNGLTKLEIPKGAIVFSINNDECRTNIAKVVKIIGDNKKMTISNDDESIVYRLNKTMVIADFDCQYNIEYGKGIYFFRTKEEAEEQDL